MEGRGHVDTGHSNIVSWGTFPSVDSLSNNAHGARDMSNGDLVRRLLDLDLLEANKFA
jgi:hypothetical protein